MNPHHSYLFATVKQTPRGSVVVLGDRLITDEVSDDEALALARRINNRHRTWELMETAA